MRERSLVRVTQQILNRPVMVTDRHASVILSALRSELNIDLIETFEGTSLDRAAMRTLAHKAMDQSDERDARRAQQQEYKLFAEQQGIAIIPITGTLMKNWGLDPYSGSTGYDGIKMKLIAALEDDDISAIYLDIDSPGGVVSGCFDLADLIFASNAKNGGKPIWAISNEQACSAAYALGCSADELFVPRTAEVGSVGVLWLYTNIEGALEQEGIKVRIFRAGKFKAEGNAYETLEKETADRIQTELEEMREIFVETVARGRGLSKKFVRDLPAITYMGSHARDIKFANDVASDDQVWTQMVERFGR